MEIKNTLNQIFHNPSKIFQTSEPPTPRNFLSDIHDQLFSLLSPLFIFMLFRFYKQLPLEEYGNNSITRIKQKDEIKKPKKNLPTNIIDYISRGLAIAFLIFYLNDFFLSLKLSGTDFKTKALFGIKVLTLISYFFLTVSAILSPHLTWFMIAKLLISMIVLEREGSWIFFMLNVILTFINMIGLQQKPWRRYFSYYSFDIFSRFICFTMTLRLIVNFFF